MTMTYRALPWWFRLWYRVRPLNSVLRHIAYTLGEEREATSLQVYEDARINIRTRTGPYSNDIGVIATIMGQDVYASRERAEYWTGYIVDTFRRGDWLKYVAWLCWQADENRRLQREAVRALMRKRNRKWRDEERARHSIDDRELFADITGRENGGAATRHEDPVFDRWLIAIMSVSVVVLLVFLLPVARTWVPDVKPFVMMALTVGLCAGIIYLGRHDNGDGYGDYD
jgi:hypothetical protein